MNFVGCPRCGEPLDDAPVGSIHVDVCSGCAGVLVMVPYLAPLLRAVAGEMMKHMDIEHRLEPVADHGERAHCPACRSPMDRGGYMGTNLVHIDRCGGCELIWIDPGELELMAQLYARTERRNGERFRVLEERMEEMDRRVVATLLSRSREARTTGLLGR